MSCTAEDRTRVHRAADQLREFESMVAVDVLQPANSQFDSWTIDAVVRSDERIPTEVLRELALEDLDLRPMPSRHEYSSVVATA